MALAERFPRVTTSPRGMPVTVDDAGPSGVSASTDYVSPQFFSMMGIDVLAGSTFSWADTLETRPVAMISQSLARALASDGDLVGRRLTMRTLPTDLQVEVIGIVADVTQGDRRQPRPHVVYRPALEASATSAFSAGLLVAATDRAAAVSGVRDAVEGFGRDYVFEMAPLAELLARAPSAERMSALVAVCVGSLGVMLAFIGVYGAFAYATARRRREIGLRVALGATPASVARSVLGEGLRVTLLGLMVGLPLAGLAARLLSTLLFGVSPGDLKTHVAVGAFFLILGGAAVLIPARRSARVMSAASNRLTGPRHRPMGARHGGGWFVGCLPPMLC